MKLYRVSTSLWVRSKDFTSNTNEIEVKDGKTYSGDGHRISKDKIMRIDTNHYENSGSIHYFTWCFEEQLEEARLMLKNHIIKKVKQYKEDIDALYEIVISN